MSLFEAFAEPGGTAQWSCLWVELLRGASLLVALPGQLRLAAELLQMLNLIGARRPC